DRNVWAGDVAIPCEVNLSRAVTDTGDNPDVSKPVIWCDFKGGSRFDFFGWLAPVEGEDVIVSPGYYWPVWAYAVKGSSKANVYGYQLNAPKIFKVYKDINFNPL
ncbi:MAG: hypothetical protein ACRC5A_08785, partial [Enterobacteriaceae bacterium]